MGQLHFVIAFVVIIVQSCLLKFGYGAAGVQGDNNIVLYITPSVNESCPDNPCLTLQEFAKEVSMVESNTTVIFMPGNHGLDSIVSLSSVHYLAILSESLLIADPDPQFSITCQLKGRFEFVNIDHLWMKGITFNGCSNKASLIKAFKVENCSFEGTNYSRTALEIDQAVAKIISSSFRANVADHCLCVYVNGVGDVCVSVAGALLIVQSNASITSSMFQRNSAEIGGAMYIRSSSNVTVTDSTFIANEAINSDIETTCSCICPEEHNNNKMSSYRHSIANKKSRFNVCSGGGIALISGSRLTINSSTFNNSRSECIKGGSALSVSDYSTASIYNSEFWSNNAMQERIWWCSSSKKIHYDSLQLYVW